MNFGYSESKKQILKYISLTIKRSNVGISIVILVEVSLPVIRIPVWFYYPQAGYCIYGTILENGIHRANISAPEVAECVFVPEPSPRMWRMVVLVCG